MSASAVTWSGEVLVAFITADLSVVSPLGIARARSESWTKVAKVAVPIAVSVGIAVAYLVITGNLVSPAGWAQTMPAVDGASSSFTLRFCVGGRTSWNRPASRQALPTAATKPDRAYRDPRITSWCCGAFLCVRLPASVVPEREVLRLCEA